MTCPFHEIDPGQVVNVQVHGGYILPMSAEMACDSWHTSQAINAALDKARVAIAEDVERIFQREGYW